ncbi:MAG: hypothetical protein LBM64_07380, partial [Deltaproteobacteria bacterium]|nr:hypothetical protein [Deltaproteobacteria bacterium]
GDVTINGTSLRILGLSGLSLFSRSGSTHPVISGNVTGKRYSVSGNSICTTAGGGATFFPGTIAGTTDTGGQYT